MMVIHYKDQRKKRHLRVRGKVRGVAERPRLSVFRSNRHIYGQVIDDEERNTLVAASSHDLQETATAGDKKEVARQVGQLLAKRCLKQGIRSVTFDRGGYRYHGRVKALAEGAREGGLEF